MTPERRREFESDWPQLAVRVTALARSRGLPAAQCDDIVQETALRLFGMWERVLPGSSVWALTKTIALNVMRDRARRPEPELTSAVPETAIRGDVEEAGIARVELGRVATAMHELTPAQRAALLAEVGERGGSPTRDAASKMLRLRARQKLTRLLQRSPAMAPLRSGRLSEFGQWIASLREGAIHGASCLVCLILGLGTVVVVPGAVPPADEAAQALLQVDPVSRSDGGGYASDAIEGPQWDSFGPTSGAPASGSKRSGSGGPKADPDVGLSAEENTASPVPVVPEDLPLPKTNGPKPEDVGISPPPAAPGAPGGPGESPLPYTTAPEDVTAALTTLEVAI